MNEVAIRRVEAMKQIIELLQPFEPEEIGEVVAAATAVLRLARAAPTTVPLKVKSHGGRPSAQTTKYKMSGGPSYSLKEAAQMCKTSEAALRVAAKAGRIFATATGPLRLGASSVRSYQKHLEQYRKDLKDRSSSSRKGNAPAVQTTLKAINGD